MSKLLATWIMATSLHLLQSEFRPIEFYPDRLICNATLTTRVPFQCKQKVAENQRYSVWKTSLDFRFGIITKSDWKSLVKTYTEPWAASNILDGSTQLFEPFDPTRNYSLIDFLPVVVRALDGYDFEEEEEPLPEGQALPPLPPLAPHLYNKSVLVPNCWATVYEFLREITECRRGNVNTLHEVYSTGDVPAQNWLDVATSRLAGSYTDHRRKFGDVILVYLRDPQMKRAILEHAVVFVDDSIVFEKAGTGDKNPYRLIDVSTVEREWKPKRLGGLFDWELHRPFLRTDQAQSFRERFSLASQRADSRWPVFWSWPQELQTTFALGVADNPRNPKEIDELTLLRCRQYNLKKMNDRWRPVRINFPLSFEALMV